MPKRKDSAATTNPRSSASRSGRVEKLTSPSVASRIILGACTSTVPQTVRGLRRERRSDGSRATRTCPDEAVALRHRAERLDDAPVGESEVAGRRGNVDVRELAQEAVVETGRVPLEPALGPVGHDAVDDVVALAPPLGELRQQLGRMLEVAVHDDDRVAAREIDSGGDRELVAEVACELITLKRGSPRCSSSMSG